MVVVAGFRGDEDDDEEEEDEISTPVTTVMVRSL